MSLPETQTAALCVKETKESSRGGELTSRELKHRCDVKNNRLTFSEEFKVLQRHKDINMYGASGGLFYMHYRTASLFSLLHRCSWFFLVCSRQTHTSMFSKCTKRVSGCGGVRAALQGFPAWGCRRQMFKYPTGYITIIGFWDYHTRILHCDIIDCRPWAGFTFKRYNTTVRKELILRNSATLSELIAHALRLVWCIDSNQALA